MALIWADNQSVPVTIPLGTDGYAKVTALTLSLRFQFRADTVYVEEEICDSDTGIVSHAIGQLSITDDDGKMWFLKAGQYRAYGLTKSLLDASTDVMSTRASSTTSIQMPILRQVKVEPRLHTIHELSDDSKGESHPIPKSTIPSTVERPIPTS